MNTESMLEKVDQVVSPICEGLGYRLIEREYVNDRGRWILRLYIDREGWVIGIEDCERVSHAVEGVLDVENLIPYRYSLEVSSPGLNRPLRRKEDFQKFAGSYISLKTREPLNGRQNYKGVLKGLIGDLIIMVIDKEEYKIPLDALSKARVEKKF